MRIKQDSVVRVLHLASASSGANCYCSRYYYLLCYFTPLHSLCDKGYDLWSLHLLSKLSFRQCLLALFNQVHLVARHRDLSYYLKRRRLILSVWTGVEDSPDSQVAMCQFLCPHLFCSLFLPNSFCGWLRATKCARFLENEMRELLFKKEEKRAVKCELKYKVCPFFRGFFLLLSLFVSTCMMFYICFLIPPFFQPTEVSADPHWHLGTQPCDFPPPAGFPLPTIPQMGAPCLGDGCGSWARHHPFPWVHCPKPKPTGTPEGPW